ncbi:hypothetical protein ACERII_06235 [Evansella sp. AB-rgal1]|uniref:hypothetical protein n=1 Tax=Evansella sp. AB-rgal1 TaxID=3242696 RepID=UPI00359E73C8
MEPNNSYYRNDSSCFFTACFSEFYDIMGDIGLLLGGEHRMKKWWFGIAIGLIIIIGLSILWWSLQSPLSSGVYVEKQAGLAIAEVDKADKTIPFSLPVQWVKAHPWEKAPTLDDILLIDSDGDIISTMEGGYVLSYSAGDWYDRVITTEIELYVNAEAMAEESLMSYYPLTNSLKDSYELDEFQFTISGKDFVFPLQDTYKILPIVPIGSESPNAWEMQGYSPVLSDDHSVMKGYIFHLEGDSSHAVLEDIHYWFPGMSDEYLEAEVLYLNDWDFSTDERYKVIDEGEQLSLPLEVENNSLLLYFPLTEEIIERVEDSLLRSMPRFIFSDDGSSSYYVDGGMSIGPFVRDKDWNEHVISAK